MKAKLATNSGRRHWLVLAVTVAAQFMVIVDVSVVNVALPAIKDDLHFSQESLQWVITSYSILFGGTLLLGGRLADLLGRRRMFMTGVAVFTLGSLLSGLAWSEEALIVTRGAAGARRRFARAGRVVDRRHHLPRGARAECRARRLGCRLRLSAAQPACCSAAFSPRT